MDGYKITETDDYISVQPEGYITDARKTRTFWKNQGWTMELVKKFYTDDELSVSRL